MDSCFVLYVCIALFFSLRYNGGGCIGREWCVYFISWLLDLMVGALGMKAPGADIVLYLPNFFCISYFYDRPPTFRSCDELGDEAALTDTLLACMVVGTWSLVFRTKTQ